MYNYLNPCRDDRDVLTTQVNTQVNIQVNTQVVDLDKDRKREIILIFLWFFYPCCGILEILEQKIYKNENEYLKET